MTKKLLIFVCAVTAILCLAFGIAGCASANPQKDEYTVTLNADGGSVSQNTVTVKYGDSYSFYIPSKTGYDFTGWWYGEDQLTGTDGKGLDVWSIKSNVTATAHWTGITYQLRLDPGDTGTVESAGAFVTYGSSFTLEKPESMYDGYTFAGWYCGTTQITDAEGSGLTVWNIAETDSSGIIEVTAGWSKDYCSVSFDANGGTLAAGNAAGTVASGSLLAEPEDPVRSGYKFLGWSTQKVTDGSAASAVLWDFSTAVTEDITLYAVWEALPGVSLDISGATFSGAAVNGTAGSFFLLADYTTDSIDLASLLSYEEGCIVAVYADLSLESMLSGLTVPEEGVLADGYSTYYIAVSNGEEEAVYELDIYRSFAVTITFTDGTNELMDAETAYTGVDLASDYMKYVEGYSIQGIFTVSGEEYEEEYVWEPLYVYYAEDVLPVYTVTLDTDGGTLDVGTGGTYDSGSNTYSIAATLGKECSLGVPVKPGYTFDGWLMDGTLITGPDGIVEEWSIIGDVSVTASWSADRYTVVYAEDGIGSTAASQTIVTYGEEYTLEVPVAQTAGYTFAGWYYGDTPLTDENGTGLSAWDIIPEGTTEIEVTAKWDTVTCTVTFDANGGMFADSTENGGNSTGTGTETGTENGAETGRISYTLDYGTCITAPADPYRSGYSFAGWSTTQDGTDIYDVETPVTADITLYAVWEELAGVDLEISGAVQNSGTGSADSAGSFFLLVDHTTDSIDLATLLSYADGCTVTLYAGASIDYGTELDSFVITESSGLKDGSSEYCIAVSNGEETAVYELLIYRSFEVKITYIACTADTDGTAGTDGSTVTLDSTTVYTGYTATADIVKAFTGYEYAGIYAAGNDEDGTDRQAYEEELVLQDLVVYYTSCTYTVTLDTAGGELEGYVEGTAITVIYGREASIGIPARTGYTFTGWSYDDESITDESGTVSAWTITDGNITLTAGWTAKTYTVTLQLDGGELNGSAEESSITVTYDGSCSFGTPTRTGYTFTGWYDGETQVTGADGTVSAWNIVEDITITASWEANTYTVQLDAGDGTLTGNTSVQVEYGQSITFGVPEERTGYTFEGWYYGEEKITDADGYIAAWTLTDDNITLTAGWTGITYTVTLDAGGGTLENGTMATVVYGDEFSFEVPVREGYGFEGWYAGGTDGTKLTDDEGNGIGVWSIAEDTTVTAVWGAVKYTVTLDANGGELESGNYTVKVEYGEAVSLGVPVKTGYSFTGWYDGDTEVTGPDGTMAEWSIANDVTLTAHWSVNTYTVTLELDGGELDNSTDEKEVAVTYDDGPYSFGTPTKMGYTFAGWFSDGTQITGEDGKIDVWNIAENITITAGWNAITYTIQLDAGEGTLAGSTSVQIEYGQSITFEIPERTGYTFEGWYNGEDIITGEDSTVTAWSIADDITLTAMWTAETYTVTLNLEGGDLEGYVEGTGITVTYGKEASFGVPAKDGYDFTGWHYDGESITGADGTVSSWSLTEDNITLTAGWTGHTYTVTLDAGDGTLENGTTTQAVYGESFSFGVPAREGYTFAGWYAGGANGTQLTNESGNGIGTWNIADDTTLTAKWSANTYTVTLDADGGDLGEEKTTSDVTYEQSYDFPVPTRTGYTFTGWYLSDNQLTDSDGHSLEVWDMADDDITVTAGWTVKTYNITLDLDGGELETKLETEVTYGGSFSFGTPAKTGYTFTGWYCGVEQITDVDGQGLTVWSIDSDGTITVTAGWQAKEYTLYLDADGIGSVSNAEITVQYDHDYEIPVPEYDTEEYSFTGWYYGDIQLTDTNGSSLSAWTIDTEETITVTAGWKPLHSEVTLIITLDGAETATAPGTVTGSGTYDTGESVTIEASKPYIGYEFDGWYDGEELLTADYTYTFTADGDVTYTAAYSKLAEYANLVFVSTYETCEVTGVADTGITEIVIPDGVTSIDNGAFKRCTSLESITLTFIGDSAEGSSTYFGYIFGASSYSNNSSSVPSSLKTVVLTNGAIAQYAFYGCLYIEHISLPETLTSIPSYAFSGCTSLLSVTIPSNVTSIGNNAFYNCKGLSEIYYNATEAEGLSSNNYVFYCAGQDNEDGIIVYVGDNVKVIPSRLFYPQSNSTTSTPNISSVVFGDGSQCETIGSYAFYYNTSLVNITIPENISQIGEYAFYNCTYVTSISFDAVSMDDLSARNYVFYKTGTSGEGITVTIGSSVTLIPAYLFNPYSNSSYAPKVTAIVFEDNSICESIGAYAFAYCDSLKSVAIPDKVSYIANYAFYNCTSIEEIYFDASDMYNLGETNYVFCKAGTEGDGIAVTIGADVTQIPEYLFYPYVTKSETTYKSNAPKITSVTFEEGSVCESIGTYSFAYCIYLTDVTLPDSLTFIAEEAFVGCDELTSVVFADTTGWYVAWSGGYDAAKEFSPEELEDPSDAADFILAYISYEWHKVYTEEDPDTDTD